MFDFGKHADYMAMGYAVTVIALTLMVAYLYLRYRALTREEAQIAQLEEEVREEQAQQRPAMSGVREV